ncbi:hypothetical protein GUJ93_ZPchr0013g37869 [Zizania palustris]|uniref:Protein kinase domain-containing protein n=1 Tax=Zizania palustris TaxID=103762 RepID=A0A8J5X312_ZIZPA|nr:hypothetical protein GUJ93_ZPchr0013g37869 [Zizania palustris]
MGNCWGARIKDGSPRPGASGLFARNGAKDGSRLSGCNSRASSASMPPTTKTECEILQSANVKIFSFTDLRQATRDFRQDSMLGEGGFGSVYKGWLDENTLSACKPGTGIPVAVKRLKQESLQGHREWLVSMTAILFCLFCVILISTFICVNCVSLKYTIANYGIFSVSFSVQVNLAIF